MKIHAHTVIDCLMDLSEHVEDTLEGLQTAKGFTDDMAEALEEMKNARGAFLQAWADSRHDKPLHLK